MKHISTALFLTATVLCSQGETNTNSFASDEAKVSYSVGLNLGRNFKNQNFEVDTEMLLKGLKDMMSGQPLLNDMEARNTLNEFSKKMETQRREKAKVIAEKSKKDGEAFLAENTKKEGVKTLPSGLQYKVISQGDGDMPKATDMVSVNYRGTLLDGKEFDSSYKRNQPANFSLNQVIKGWTEALQMMKTGSKWQLFVPSDLAYGEAGRGREIDPNSTLIFDVELLSILPPPPTPAGVVTGEIIRVPSAEDLKKGAKIEAVKPPQPAQPVVK